MTNNPTPVLVDSEGHTSCCGSVTSISIDDGVEYCKGCYEAVSDYTTTPTRRTSVKLAS